jgi:hypothetical protein
MNDQEFIELLNLYLDQEISAADAARLEAEVQSNLQRRHIYRQYCQMQKACKFLAADFQTEPTGGADTKVVSLDFAAAHSRTRAVYGLSFVAAAAACVALILVARGGLKSSSSTGLTPVAVQASPGSPLDRTAFDISARMAKPKTVSGGSLVQRPMLVSDPLWLAGRPAVGELALVSQPNDQLAWIGALTMAPRPHRIAIETLRFEPQSTILRQGNRTLPPRQSTPESPAEMTAFRFVK